MIPEHLFSILFSDSKLWLGFPPPYLFPYLQHRMLTSWLQKEVKRIITIPIARCHQKTQNPESLSSVSKIGIESQSANSHFFLLSLFNLNMQRLYCDSVLQKNHSFRYLKNTIISNTHPIAYHQVHKTQNNYMQ